MDANENLNSNYATVADGSRMADRTVNISIGFGKKSTV